MIPISERLIVALDVPTTERAIEIVEELGTEVSFYKIGMQLQFAGGIQLADTLIKKHGKKVFLDSKLLDIGQTIESAVRNIADMGVSFLTVHGNGKVIRAAISGRGDSELKILSVTFLTNLDANDLADMGYYNAVDDPRSVEKFVISRAQRAIEAGADGVISSGEEASEIREMAGPNLKIVTPGIRRNGDEIHDQSRITTPFDAITSGADYLVVGRSITTAKDMLAAAEDFNAQIAQAVKVTHLEAAE